MCQWNSGGKRVSRYAGILPAPYHGNRYSIPDCRADCKDFFACCPHFWVYAPQYSCTSGSFFFRSRNATGSRYTTTVSSMEAS